MSKKPRYNKVVCTGINMGESKGGHPQVVFSLRIIEGDRTGEDITMFQVLPEGNEKGREILVAQLRAVGMTNDDISNPEGIGSVAATLQEKWEMYEGQGKWKATGVFEPKAPATMDQGSADAFSASLSALFANTAPVTVGDHNKAPEALPEKVARQAAPVSEAEAEAASIFGE